MNGPSHYREAERLLADATELGDNTYAALAQVHATLALAAVTAESVVHAYTGSTGNARGWTEATA